MVCPWFVFLVHSSSWLLSPVLLSLVVCVLNHTERDHTVMWSYRSVLHLSLCRYLLGHDFPCFCVVHVHPWFVHVLDVWVPHFNNHTYRDLITICVQCFIIFIDTTVSLLFHACTCVVHDVFLFPFVVSSVLPNMQFFLLTSTLLCFVLNHHTGPGSLCPWCGNACIIATWAFSAAPWVYKLSWLQHWWLAKANVMYFCQFYYCLLLVTCNFAYLTPIVVVIIDCCLTCCCCFVFLSYIQLVAHPDLFTISVAHQVIHYASAWTSNMVWTKPWHTASVRASWSPNHRSAWRRYWWHAGSAGGICLQWIDAHCRHVGSTSPAS